MSDKNFRKWMDAWHQRILIVGQSDPPGLNGRPLDAAFLDSELLAPKLKEAFEQLDSSSHMIGNPSLRDKFMMATGAVMSHAGRDYPTKFFIWPLLQEAIEQVTPARPFAPALQRNVS